MYVTAGFVAAVRTLQTVQARRKSAQISRKGDWHTMARVKDQKDFWSGILFIAFGCAGLWFGRRRTGLEKRARMEIRKPSGFCPQG
jgi:hypothetical protein